VLSRGLISGHWRKGSTVANDFRTHSPRFQGENVEANLALVEALRKVAEGNGVQRRAGGDRLGGGQGNDIVPLAVRAAATARGVARRPRRDG